MDKLIEALLQSFLKYNSPTRTTRCEHGILIIRGHYDDMTDAYAEYDGWDKERHRYWDKEYDD